MTDGTAVTASHAGSAARLAGGGTGRHLRAILLGPPGAGKGTQAERVATAYGVPHVSTGDIFRRHVRDGTELGRRSRSYLESGELVPDDLVIGMVADRLAQPDADGFVLDGFPRTVPQAQALEELLDGEQRPLDVVLRLAIGEAEIVRRITGRRVCPACGATFHVDHQPAARDGVCDQCGTELTQRRDDTEEVVSNRLSVYRRQTEPLEYFYWQRSLLRDVEAVGSVDEITQRALSVLADYVRPSRRGDARDHP